MDEAHAFCMNSVVLCTPRAWIGQEANEALFQDEAIPGLQPGLRCGTWVTKVVAAALPRGPHSLAMDTLLVFLAGSLGEFWPGGDAVES